MEIRESKKGNLKVTMTNEEAAVIASVLSYVRLGTSDLIIQKWYLIFSMAFLIS